MLYKILDTINKSLGHSTVSLNNKDIRDLLLLNNVDQVDVDWFLDSPFMEPVVKGQIQYSEYGLKTTYEHESKDHEQKLLELIRLKPDCESAYVLIASHLIAHNQVTKARKFLKLASESCEYHPLCSIMYADTLKVTSTPESRESKLKTILDSEFSAELQYCAALSLIKSYLATSKTDLAAEYALKYSISPCADNLIFNLLKLLVYSDTQEVFQDNCYSLLIQIESNFYEDSPFVKGDSEIHHLLPEFNYLVFILYCSKNSKSLFKFMTECSDFYARIEDLWSDEEPDLELCLSMLFRSEYAFKLLGANSWLPLAINPSTKLTKSFSKQVITAIESIYPSIVKLPPNLTRCVSSVLITSDRLCHLAIETIYKSYLSGSWVDTEAISNQLVFAKDFTRVYKGTSEFIEKCDTEQDALDEFWSEFYRPLIVDNPQFICDTAIHSIDALLSRSANPDFLFIKGWCYSELYKYHDAINTYNELISSIDNEMPSVHFNLALAYYSNRNYTDFIKQAEWYNQQSLESKDIPSSMIQNAHKTLESSAARDAVLGSIEYTELSSAPLDSLLYFRNILDQKSDRLESIQFYSVANEILSNLFLSKDLFISLVANGWAQLHTSSQNRFTVGANGKLTSESEDITIDIKLRNGQSPFELNSYVTEMVEEIADRKTATELRDAFKDLHYADLSDYALDLANHFRIELGDGPKFEETIHHIVDTVGLEFGYAIVYHKTQDAGGNIHSRSETKKHAINKALKGMRMHADNAIAGQWNMKIYDRGYRSLPMSKMVRQSLLICGVSQKHLS